MNDDGFAYFLRSQESGVRSHRVRSQEFGKKNEEERTFFSSPLPITYHL
ncbi:MAG: hypothetical protein HEQ25_15475 [Dolichospermum sp. DET73]|nr:hypothetical protein [Dolichospermum sp. DET73]